MLIQNQIRLFGNNHKKIMELPTVERQKEILKILDKIKLILEKQEQSRLLANKLFSSVIKDSPLVDGLEL